MALRAVPNSARLGDRYIDAYDCNAGQQRWRTARPPLALLGNRSDWATPLVWKNDLRTEIVTSDYGGVRSYSPGGNMLWELRGPSSNLVIPSPIAAHGVVYVTSGYWNTGRRISDDVLQNKRAGNSEEIVPAPLAPLTAEHGRRFSHSNLSPPRLGPSRHAWTPSVHWGRVGG